MPYDRARDVPPHLAGLTVADANRWASVFDARVAVGDPEDRAARIAWGALRKAGELAGIADPETGEVYPVASYALPVEPTLTSTAAPVSVARTAVDDLVALWERLQVAHREAERILTESEAPYDIPPAAAVLLWLHIGEVVPVLKSRDVVFVDRTDEDLPMGEIEVGDHLLSCLPLASALQRWRSLDGSRPVWDLTRDDILALGKRLGIGPDDPARLLVTLKAAANTHDEITRADLVFSFGRDADLLPSFMLAPGGLPALLNNGEGLNGDLFSGGRDDMAVGAWLAAIRASVEDAP
jgi:hypothetical protein